MRAEEDRRLAVVVALREANRPRLVDPQPTVAIGPSGELAALRDRVTALEQLGHRVSTVERETATLRKIVMGLTGHHPEPVAGHGAGQPGSAARRRAAVPALPDLSAAGRALDGVLFGHPTEH